MGRDEQMQGKSKEEQFSVLMKRPTIDEVTVEYKAMLRDIRQNISDKLSSIEFREDPDTGSTGGCGSAYQGIDRRTAQSHNLNIWHAEKALTGKDWETALEVVKRIAAKHDFKNVRVFQDQPSNHDVFIANQNGDELNFGSANNTVLGMHTGCYLTPEAKRRGSLPPEPTY